jgi:hypothetical protein
VHLLGNACGGNHEELLAGSLAFRPPYSRAVTDDMTVQAIFFREGRGMHYELIVKSAQILQRKQRARNVNMI